MNEEELYHANMAELASMLPSAPADSPSPDQNSLITRKVNTVTKSLESVSQDKGLKEALLNGVMQCKV